MKVTVPARVPTRLPAENPTVEPSEVAPPSGPIKAYLTFADDVTVNEDTGTDGTILTITYRDNGDRKTVSIEFVVDNGMQTGRDVIVQASLPPGNGGNCAQAFADSDYQWGAYASSSQFCLASVNGKNVTLTPESGFDFEDISVNYTQCVSIDIR